MHDNSWSTKREVEYLEGLGCHRNRSTRSARGDVRERSTEERHAERLKMLREYRKSMDQRDWGKLDRAVITEKVEQLIAELQGR